MIRPARAFAPVRARTDATGRGRRRATAVPGALVTAVVTVLVGLLVGLPAGAPAASAAPAPSDAEPPETPLVLAGVSGLQWSDVDAVRTPELWRLMGGGSVASVAVRTLTPTCPVEGWLTLSAGSKAHAQSPVADDAQDGEDDADEPDGAPALGCATVPVPSSAVADDAGATEPATTRVPGWDDLAATDPLTPNAAEPGALGELADVAGTCTTAVGPGAAVALADAGGDVPRYLPDAGRLTAAQVADCPATVVDLGVLPDAANERTAAVEELDAQVGRLADLLPAGGRLVVAGVSDTPLGPADLQVVVDWTSPGGRATWLTSTSSRWAGVVVLADLSATVADTVTGGALSGTAPTADATDDPEAGDDGDDADEALHEALDEALAPFTGSPLERGDDRRISVSRTVENRQYLSVLTDTVPRLSPLVLGIVGLVDVVVVGALLLARRRGTAPDGRGRRYGRRVALAVLVVASSLPGAASLATLSRWWASPAPVTSLVLSLTVAALVAALVAWFARRLLPPSPWRLTTSIAGVTWLVVTVDGLTGTTLQQGSLLGPAPSLGARFYGFSNTVFAVYAVAGLVLAAGLAAAVRARGGGRARAGWVAAAVGVVTVLVDGLPPFGADFGGILALAPGFAVLALGVGGVRITWRRVLAVAAGTVLLVAVVSLVDWLLPGPGSHLGGFVESIVEGRAVGVVVGKAAGAWATIANPAGAAALVLCAVVAWAVLSPARARLDDLAHAYRRDPALWRLVVALVVTAGVGTLLNDSGVAVAAIVLALAVPVLLAGRLADHEEPGAPARDAAARDAGPVLARVPAVLAGASAGLLVALLVGTTALPGAGPARAGGVSGAGTPLVDDAGPVVVVGTQGLRWEDVSPSATPTLWDALRDGASAAGVTPAVGGASATCPAAGWLGLSSGRSPVTGQNVEGTWECAPWEVTDASGTDGSTEGGTEGADGGATVDGWDELAALQSSSEFRPTLGVLGDALADGEVCTTAVAPGAALALAGRDGVVPRYRTLDAALADPADAFSCPVTVVDAGSAPYHPDPEGYTGRTPPPEDATSDGPARDTALRAVDETVGRVLAAVPADATVLVTDVGNPAPGRPSLGVGVADADADDAPAYLTSGATHWLGVVRLLDLPTTLVTAFDLPAPADLSGSPVELASERPAGTGATVRELAGLTQRDHMLRVTTGTVTTLPAYVGLAAFALVVLLLPRLRRRAPRAARRWARVLDAVLLVCGSVAAAAFLMTAWGWWRLADPVTALWLTLGASTVVVALVGALAPRRPVWAGATVIATLTFVVLTVDALLGTPLHRGSPLGSAPTLGGRYYGFGNPTYSVYATAAVIAAAGLATAVRRRWGAVPAGVVASVVGLVTLVVSVWPTLGADVGGGLVLLPVFVVVVLGVLEARVTWRRLLLAGLAGVALVAAIGVVDWLRPPAQRTHLGAFVQSVVDGTAVETIARKAGYALRSLSGGVPAWLALAVLVGLVAVLWGGPRLRARWLERSEARWPLLRPVLVSLLLAGVGGAVVNDYGIRMVSIMLAAAVPLVGLVVLRTWMTDPPDAGQPASREPSDETSDASSDETSGASSAVAAAERPGT